ncbi:MAG TPA: SDR family NAD(P)-dependent oxidoreductase, partial [Solirubrobacteraceae bacterium]|nr:SDR family NAD(P)-dependent oxidoreductase [Solirubrobacteraceae bacterium]
LQSAYCAAKHAIQGFTESLRCELLHQSSGVHVTMVQLPALNTPQFEVVRARVSHHPRPVAPVYQPELAARAILAAAEHPARREWWVGGSTALSVIGNAISPGAGDRYLARSAYQSQLAEDRIESDRPDNLFGPVSGDHGARGRFSDESTERSAQWTVTRHRRVLGVAGAASALAAAAAAGVKLRGR